MIAERLGYTVSALIRLLVSSYVEYYEREGGHVTLPLGWNEILQRNLSSAVPRKVAEKPFTYKKPRNGMGEPRQP
jgi:hypothetical protein